MDNCVSYYHFEKLLHNQGLDQDANYQDYAKKLYLKGKLVYGDYWTHLKDAWIYKKIEKNFKLIWFEDMRADLSKAIRDIAEFTEYQVPKFLFARAPSLKGSRYRLLAMVIV